MVVEIQSKLWQPCKQYSSKNYWRCYLGISGRTGYRTERLAAEYLGQGPPSLEELTGTGAKRRGLHEIDVDEVARWAAAVIERREAVRLLGVPIRDRDRTLVLSSSPVPLPQR